MKPKQVRLNVRKVPKNPVYRTFSACAYAVYCENACNVMNISKLYTVSMVVEFEGVRGMLPDVSFYPLFRWLKNSRMSAKYRKIPFTGHFRRLVITTRY